MNRLARSGYSRCLSAIAFTAATFLEARGCESSKFVAQSGRTEHAISAARFGKQVHGQILENYLEGDQTMKLQENAGIRCPSVLWTR